MYSIPLRILKYSIHQLFDIARHCIARHCIARHCTARHCIVRHCIARHCIARHCIARHCNITESLEIISLLTGSYLFCLYLWWELDCNVHLSWRRYAVSIGRCTHVWALRVSVNLVDRYCVALCGECKDHAHYLFYACDEIWTDSAAFKQLRLGYIMLCLIRFGFICWPSLSWVWLGYSRPKVWRF